MAAQTKVTAILSALNSSGIIPDVLPAAFKPTFSISVNYPTSKSDVTLGNTLTPEATAEAPTVQLELLENVPVPSASTSYSLVLTDPDARSRQEPIWSEFCHWIATNITLPESFATEKKCTLKLTPGHLMEYMGPAPPPKTAFHRYVFLLLAADSNKALPAPKERRQWGYGKQRQGVRNWAGENGLDLIGANFFYAQNKHQ